MRRVGVDFVGDRECELVGFTLDGRDLGIDGGEDRCDLGVDVAGNRGRRGGNVGGVGRVARQVVRLGFDRRNLGVEEVVNDVDARLCGEARQSAGIGQSVGDTASTTVLIAATSVSTRSSIVSTLA
jgi:hypothetical protein